MDPPWCLRSGCPERVLALGLVAGVTVPGCSPTPARCCSWRPRVLGLPHGAVDHLAGDGPAVLCARRSASSRRYAAAALAAVAVALLLPLPALLVLLALSVAHFAEGEVGWARLTGRPGCWPAGAAAGLAVVALPLLLRPADVRPLLAELDPAAAGRCCSRPTCARCSSASRLLVVVARGRRRPAQP